MEHVTALLFGLMLHLLDLRSKYGLALHLLSHWRIGTKFDVYLKILYFVKVDSFYLEKLI